MDPPPPPPPSLPADLVEEVLLRLPPADPASLVRAALVCKPWCRLISNPGSRRRFREFHRKAPRLGVLCNTRDNSNGDFVVRFVPTSSSCTPLTDQRGWLALDARHGRVLLRGMAWEPCRHAVWDPLTDERWELPTAPLQDVGSGGSNAAVLCAASGGACDHLDCHGGPFRVVLMGHIDLKMHLCVYSSEAGAWTVPTYISPYLLYDADMSPAALVGNALYFSIAGNKGILKYDLITLETSVIEQPPKGISPAHYLPTRLVTMEDDNLGVAKQGGKLINFWKMDASPGGGVEWIRVTELKKLLPVDTRSAYPVIVGSADDFGVFFAKSVDGLSIIDLKSGRVTKVCSFRKIESVVPYFDFHTPVLGARAIGGEEPGGHSSSACKPEVARARSVHRD